MGAHKGLATDDVQMVSHQGLARLLCPHAMYDAVSSLAGDTMAT